jgi:zinc transporter ZupT
MPLTEAMLIIFGLIFFILHYYTPKIKVAHKARRMKIVSFTAGIFITYLFLHLLPAIYDADISFTRISVIFVLIGFSLFHIAEKFIYKYQGRDREKLRRELKEVHSLMFFIYHFVIGMVLVNVTNQLSIIGGILFFIPVLLHTAVSSLSFSEIYGVIREKISVRLLLSLSTLAGIIVSIFFPLTLDMYHILLGFVLGAMFYLVIVESIPRERRGEPMFFILGVIVYAILIGVSWLF